MNDFDEYLTHQHFDIRSNPEYLTWYAKQIKSNIQDVRFLSVKNSSAMLALILKLQQFSFNNTRFWKIPHNDLVFYLLGTKKEMTVEMRYFGDEENFRSNAVANASIKFIEHLIPIMKER